MKYNTIPSRERRRAYLHNVRSKARLLAERRHAEDVQEKFSRSKRYKQRAPWPTSNFYRRLMKGQGHWLKGGCSITRCGICQPREASFQTQRQHARFDEEWKEWQTRNL